MTSYILQPYAHKDDNDRRQNNNNNAEERPRRSRKRLKKRVVGAYRHVNVLCCTTSCLAMSLFVRQFTDEKMRTMTFRYDDEGNRPTWRKVKLVQWASDRSAYQTYSRILQANDIQWCKVTHMRTAGMERASAEGGLDAEQIATMSKHRAERIFEAYLTELMPAVLKVMAGLRQNDPYVVPRTEVELPFAPDVCTKLLFPKIDDWRVDISRHDGDKHTSAANFLNKTLPYFAKVLFQDFPYWFALNPQHEFCRMFRSRMPADFDVFTWARSATQRARQILDVRDGQHVQNLNVGARAAFDQLTRHLTEFQTRHERRMENMENRLEQFNNRLGQFDNRLGGIENGVQFLVQHFLRNQGRQEQRQQQAVQIILQQPGGAATQVNRVRVGATGAQQVGVVAAAAHGAQNAVVAAAAAQGAQNAPAVLQRDPVIPAIPTKLPKTFTQLLLEHRTLHLNRYESRGKKSDWPSRVRIAYSKRLYLYGKLKTRAANTLFRPAIPMNQLEVRLDEAAKAIDTEMARNGRTVDSMLKEWKASDALVRSRRTR
jgi:hypothetical protein